MYWLNHQREANPEAFDAEVKDVCETYREAPTRYDQGIHTVSCDEKTGMQALERCHPTKPMKPGLIERREYEYTRYGTLTLIANFEVATGQVITPTLGPTRTEADFARHLRATIESDPQAQWIFVMDQLNIHKSESVVGLGVVGGGRGGGGGGATAAVRRPNESCIALTRAPSPRPSPARGEGDSSVGC